MDFNKLKEKNEYACLAPMAGITDRATKEWALSFGAGYCVSELVSSKALIVGDKKSNELLYLDEKSRPQGLQIFGGDPHIMAHAAQLVAEKNPEFIDINMGCPAPKVVKNGSGSGLMEYPEKCYAIVKACKQVTDIPISVKIRSGIKGRITAVDVAKACEEAGASFITVHGRTREQMYAPPVSLDVIKDVKNTVKIPVIGNGDVYTPKDAKYMYEYTGCDYIMVGRGFLGKPWIFSHINAYLTDGVLLPEPPLSQKMVYMIQHIELMAKYKDSRFAFLEARKFASWYIKGMRGAAKFRQMCGSITCMDDVINLSKAVMESANEEQNL